MDKETHNQNFLHWDKVERFKQACPSGEVFGPYMPVPEVECLRCPDTTIAKVIDKGETDENN